MEIKDFISFRESVLIPYLQELKDNDTVNCLTINYKSINKVYQYYQTMRNLVKKVQMEANTSALDRHKVGAILIYGILRSKIIHVNKNIPNLPPHLLMANEYYAVNIALNVIEMYKRKDGEQYSNYEIIIPKPYHKHENEAIDNPFLYELCVGLYTQNIKRYFDVSAYAIILFQLEDKTDYILEIRNESSV